jgi:hypothetical protein
MSFALPLLVPWQLRAETVTYTVQPGESTITVSGRAATSFYFDPQTPGSLSDQYQGTIVADLNGSTLTFAGDSVLDAQLNPASSTNPFQPVAPGEDDYAMKDDLTGSFIIAALRDVVATVFSGTLEFGQPVTDLVSVGFTAGTLDYVAPGFGMLTPTSMQLSDFTSVPNTSTGLLTRTVSLGVETITLPVEASVVFTVVVADDSRIDLHGQIVAMRAIVPEPGIVTMAITGVLACCVVMALGRSPSRRTL